MGEIKLMIKKSIFKSNNYVFSLTLLFMISSGVVILINESYKLGANDPDIYITMWGAGDVLSFYGDYLAFIGTVALWAIAIFQTKKSNDISSRLLSIEESRVNLEIQPFVVINKWEATNLKKSQIELSPKELFIGANTSEQEEYIG